MQHVQKLSKLKPLFKMTEFLILAKLLLEVKELHMDHHN